MDDADKKPWMTGISLTKTEKDIVEDASNRLGLNNFSATLRLIIREWELLVKERKDHERTRTF